MKKITKSGCFLLALAMGMMIAPVSRAGLYDDQKDATTGDLMDQDYWWAKFDANMLELAMKQRQPEGKIGLNLVSSINRLNDLIKKYPKHEDLQKWKTRAEDIQKKIDPNAPRGASFNTNCPWDEANYAQLWVNFNYSKMLLAAGDFNTARSMLSNVLQNYDIMMKPDRMKNYPDDLKKWVEDNKPEADKMMALAKSKTGG